MDKSWMNLTNRRDKRYELGVVNFLRFAYSHQEEHLKIPCPCKKCNNFRDQTKENIEAHLMRNGISKCYTRWIYHGEGFQDDFDDDHEVVDESVEGSDEDDINDLLNDIGTANWGENWASREEAMSNSSTENLSEADSFVRLLEKANEDLYPGYTNYSKLAFVVTLLHLKTMSGWTTKSFDMLLGVFKNALPSEAKIPNSFYEAKKLIRDLGFKSEKIHACVNDCVLFRKEYANLDTCPNENCKEPRYKSICSKVPRKVLRHFPLKPRLQSLYINKDIARDMRWHKEKRVDDSNIMRHPADSEAWKHFDNNYADFAEDPRNIRLGLATDGFNPFGNMSNSYSIWHVFLIPYNLLPWKCMKDPFILMSLLIPGPKSPGNDIDIYFQPLIEELNELWAGIEAYDTYTGQKFNLRAVLLWTINDFPAYGMMSGWSTKGYSACPVCMTETSCIHLPNARKLCYMGHRQFLPSNHRWRKEKKAFDGEVEFRNPIKPLSGQEILQQLQNICQIQFGKATRLVKQRKRKRKGNENLLWKKKSIFFLLPYWADLKVRHNLDIMHVVKNVTESLWGTIMDIEHKTKDNWRVRVDLEESGLKKDLHLIENDTTCMMPAACYNLSKHEKKKVCDFLSSIKYPDGFASNISRCIKNGEFQASGMKSHNYHIFIQRILPLAIRGSLTKEVCQVVFELSSFFRTLCSRTQYLDILEKQEKNVALILCKMERIFPPSLFDIMVHLLVHLPSETKVAGPPQYRWMFPFERKMCTLKSYVNNKARPEGCIAERYIDYECSTFCSMYLRNIETIFNRVERNNDKAHQPGELSIFSVQGRPFGGTKSGVLTQSEWAKIRIFVLNNCEKIESYINEHKLKLEAESSDNIDQRHDKEFPLWFEDRVLYGRENHSDAMRSLALGPDNRVMRYTGCMINGYRFHTQDREKDRKTQNSGVVVKGEHGNTVLDFYGVLKDIIEVTYYQGRNKVLIFKCDWWNVGDNAGIQIDRDWGITSVNVSRKWYVDQPYVLADQVQQVFYVQDMKSGKNWYVVESFSPRNSYDVPEKVDKEQEDDIYQEEHAGEFSIVIELDETRSLARENTLPLQLIDYSTVHDQVSKCKTQSRIDDFINDEEDMEGDSRNNSSEEKELWTNFDSNSE